MSLVSVQEIVWGTDESDAALLIAQKGFPAGAVVHCEICGHHTDATPERIAEFLSGWPRHCGHPMEIDALTVSAKTKPKLQITFEVQPRDVPETIRLRRLLKVALRSFGFRCLRLERIEPAVSPALTTSLVEDDKNAADISSTVF